VAYRITVDNRGGEKLAHSEFEKIGSHQEALQTIFPSRLDVFYHPIFDFFQKNWLFNSRRDYHHLSQSEIGSGKRISRHLSDSVPPTNASPNSYCSFAYSALASFRCTSTGSSSHASPPPFFRSLSAISSSDVRRLLITAPHVAVQRTGASNHQMEPAPAGLRSVLVSLCVSIQPIDFCARETSALRTDS
jgi:hypothetical protein